MTLGAALEACIREHEYCGELGSAVEALGLTIPQSLLVRADEIIH
jgi:hypothetical protein